MKNPLYTLLGCFLLLACQSPTKKDSGLLYVGTTGDYAPFSLIQQGEFVGQDIDRAKRLGRALGREVVFVQTSWENLSEDLKNQRFDVAISGITITEKRRKIGEFSIPYLTFGKTPIARCAEAHRYRTLADINQKQVRVATNLGGTNEAFARSHFKEAQLVISPNNEMIFAAIIANKADVMVTDSPEVDYYSKKYKGKLCPTTDQLFTHNQMAIWMPKGSKLKEPIDRWLQGQIELD